MSYVELKKCPRCKKEIGNSPEVVEIQFCSVCKFPLMLIAGKYRLVEVIGDGGFGTVYKAVHLYLHRDAERIVKVIKEEMLTEQAKRRFFREVQLTAYISQRNEHIVRIFDDFGIIPNFSAFYVMEYLKGKTLREFLEKAKKPLPLEWILFIFGQLCNAMNSAHNEGIVHRDLKPDNIMLVKRGNNPHFLKVLDFGIAKPKNKDFSLSLTQGIIGSPHYLSPEQCQVGKITPASDTYSMGIILYELLTGVTPFYHKTSLPNLLVSHITEQPPPLSSHTLPEDFPSELEKVVMKSLAKSSQERYQDSLEFWKAIVEVVPSAKRYWDIEKKTADLPAFSEEEQGRSKEFLSFELSSEDFPSIEEMENFRSDYSRDVGDDISSLSNTSEKTSSSISHERPKEGAADAYPSDRRYLWIFAGLGSVIIFLLAWILLGQREAYPPPAPADNSASESTDRNGKYDSTEKNTKNKVIPTADKAKTAGKAVNSGSSPRETKKSKGVGTEKKFIKKSDKSGKIIKKKSKVPPKHPGSSGRRAGVKACAGGRVELRFSPSLTSTDELLIGNKKHRLTGVLRRLCVVKGSEISVNKLGFQTCIFSVPSGRRRVRIKLRREGGTMITLPNYCVK